MFRAAAVRSGVMRRPGVGLRAAAAGVSARVGVGLHVTRVLGLRLTFGVRLRGRVRLPVLKLGLYALRLLGRLGLLRLGGLLFILLLDGTRLRLLFASV